MPVLRLQGSDRGKNGEILSAIGQDERSPPQRLAVDNHRGQPMRGVEEHVQDRLLRRGSRCCWVASRTKAQGTGSVRNGRTPNWLRVAMTPDMYFFRQAATLATGDLFTMPFSRSAVKSSTLMLGEDSDFCSTISAVSAPA